MKKKSERRHLTPHPLLSPCYWVYNNMSDFDKAFAVGFDQCEQTFKVAVHTCDVLWHENLVKTQELHFIDHQLYCYPL